MPYFFMRTSDPLTQWDDLEAWRLQPGGIGMRVDYGGTSEIAVNETVVTMRPWAAEAFTEFWAIQPIVANLPDIEDLYSATLQEKGAIDCTISVDEGTTWLYWDGAAWSIAGAGDWTSFDDLNLNLAAIPFQAYRLMMRVRLQKGTHETEGPVLKAIRLGYDLLPDHAQEDCHRTMKRFFSDNLSVRFRDSFASGGTATLAVDNYLDIKGVYAAFDLTNDPTRQTNIYAGSFTADTIDLTVSPAAGNTIEVEWDGAVDTILFKRDPDFWDELDKHVPLLIVQITTATESDEASVSRAKGPIAINFPERKYWRERPPYPVDYRLMMRAIADSESLATRICSAAYELLRRKSEDSFLPLALSGTFLEILNFTPPFQDLSEVKEGLSVKSFSAILCVREWCAGIETGVLAEEYTILYEDIE